MMIQTQRLEYPDHTQEIKTLNAILADIQFGYPKGHPPEMEATVRNILDRLDLLMTASNARLKIYDQRESRI